MSCRNEVLVVRQTFTKCTVCAVTRICSLPTSRRFLYPGNGHAYGRCRDVLVKWFVQWMNGIRLHRIPYDSGYPHSDGCLRPMFDSKQCKQKGARAWFLGYSICPRCFGLCWLYALASLVYTYIKEGGIYGGRAQPQHADGIQTNPGLQCPWPFSLPSLHLIIVTNHLSVEEFVNLPVRNAVWTLGNQLG